MKLRRQQDEKHPLSLRWWRGSQKAIKILQKMKKTSKYNTVLLISLLWWLQCHTSLHYTPNFSSIRNIIISSEIFLSFLFCGPHCFHKLTKAGAGYSPWARLHSHRHRQNECLIYLLSYVAPRLVYPASHGKMKALTILWLFVDKKNTSWRLRTKNEKKDLSLTHEG